MTIFILKLFYWIRLFERRLMVRIREIELHNFKNTRHGKIQLEDLDGGGSILGLYGQNGSGKTSVIEAIGCLQSLICGKGLDESILDCIGAGTASMAVDFVFDVDAKAFGERDGRADSTSVAGSMRQGGCRAYYSFEVGTDASGTRPVLLGESIGVSTKEYSKRTLVKYSVEKMVFQESGQDARQPDSLLAMAQIGGNRSDDVRFSCEPAGKWRSLASFSEDARRSLAAGEAMAYENGVSFVFGKQLVQVLSRVLAKANCNDCVVSKTVAKALSDVVCPLAAILPVLLDFAVCDLQVSTTDRSGLISLKLLRIDELRSHDLHDKQPGRYLMLNMLEPFNIRRDVLDELEATISSLNVSLGAIVPGLSLVVHKHGPVIDDDGLEGVRAELLSDRRGVRVPFRSESEGIQKLVSILSMIIAAYNDEDACVAIDEMDSGVFEFLLGEILEAMAKGGRGQLIFTAHNLRALEMLPAKAVLFTTVNPGNRFLRFRRKKPSNNLRNQYLRTINLGGQQESVYDPTDSLSIRSAFYDSGHPNASVDLDRLIDSLGAGK